MPISASFLFDDQTLSAPQYQLRNAEPSCSGNYHHRLAVSSTLLDQVSDDALNEVIVMVPGTTLLERINAIEIHRKPINLFVVTVLPMLVRR